MHAENEPPSQSLPALREIFPKPVDWKVINLMVLCCLVLVVCRYFGGYAWTVNKTVRPAVRWLELDDAQRRLDETAAPPEKQPGWFYDKALRIAAAVQNFCERHFEKSPRKRLWQLHYWVWVHVLAYLVVPGLYIKLFLRERIRDYGLKITGWHKAWWVYVLGFGVVFPLVLLFGKTPGFMSSYPFYKDAGNSWNDFLMWEAAYAFQFFALEFFFRGVMILGLKDRFGWYSVLIMTIPYCMIHFGKPLPETLGAIIAGLFLGTLSLWTRSIWMGTAIHVSVALSMDLTAMYHKGQLGNLFGGQ